MKLIAYLSAKLAQYRASKLGMSDESFQRFKAISDKQMRGEL